MVIFKYITELREELLRLAEEYRSFSRMKEDFLLLLYNKLNKHRMKGIVPEGEYRQKGNVFRDLIEHLIWIRSGEKFRLRSRRVEGATEIHDLDLAFILDQKLIIAGEVKMLGSPPHRRGREIKPERATRKDIDKRLKEVKFTSIDLKLKYTGTQIADWHKWIDESIPQFYSFWACRIGEEDNVELIIRKFKSLRDWYNNGVGIFLFKEENGRYTPLEVEDGEMRRILVELDIDSTIDEIVRFLSKYRY